MSRSSAFYRRQCSHGYLIRSYANHQDLHSFPTRRSSDLASQIRGLQRDLVGITNPRAAAGYGRSTRLRMVAGPHRPADRKSTRLNSSHVEISYAVFCLKKKTETIRQASIDA